LDENQAETIKNVMFAYSFLVKRKQQRRNKQQQQQQQQQYEQ